MQTTTALACSNFVGLRIEYLETLLSVVFLGILMLTGLKRYGNNRMAAKSSSPKVISKIKISI